MHLYRPVSWSNISLFHVRFCILFAELICLTPLGKFPFGPTHIVVVGEVKEVLKEHEKVGAESPCSKKTLRYWPLVLSFIIDAKLNK